MSKHDRRGLLEAQEAGATYAFLSPIFAVPEKGTPIGVEGFARAVAGLHVPVFALGGIVPATTKTLLEAGAHGVAVRRAIYDSANPGATVRDLLYELDKLGSNVD
jgi:thiamine-phosphate pyrophosphorylase